MKKKIKSGAMDLLAFIAGGGLYAISVNYFTAPNQIAPGGATGVATILNFLFQWPIGTVILILNLPLFIWGLIQHGFRFLSKTIFATVISTIIIDASAPFIHGYSGDKILAALFGGILSGAGLGLIFWRGATTGGSDLVAKLLTHHLRALSLGKLILLLDLVIIAASAVAFQNLESALYAVVAIFVSTQVIDAILYGWGSGNGKMLLIFSAKNPEIAQAIMERLERGATLLRSKGAFSGSEGYTLLCAVRRPEVYKVRDIVKEIDPQAFIIVGTAEEIAGEGFLPIEEKKSK